MGEFAYFKKRHPEVPLYTEKGAIRGFTDIIGDFAYVRTDNDSLKKTFRKAAQSGIGGVSEITEADYQTEFLEKKHLSSDRPLPKDRESIGGPSGDALLARHVANNQKPVEPSKPEKSPEPVKEKVQTVSSKPLPESQKPTASKLSSKKG